MICAAGLRRWSDIPAVYEYGQGSGALRSVSIRSGVVRMRSDVEKAVQLLMRGDTNSVEEALELLQKAVFSFSMRVCGQQQDAEDTMQEVLMKSLPYLPQFTNSRALATWLYKVAKNRCLMNRRKSTFAPKEELSLEELMPNQEEFERLDGLTSITPEGSAISGEQRQRLRE